MIKKNARWIALIAMGAFFWVFQVSAFSGDHLERAESPAKSLETKNEASEAATGAVEKTGGESSIKKKRHFPWLFVAAGAILVAAAAYYFLVYQKKEFDLNVTKGEGVTGAPESGVYRRGTKVSYSFALQAEYIDLKVTLDGASVAASGTITMNKNHDLAATAREDPNITYTLKVEHYFSPSGTPAAGTYIYPKGTVVNYSYSCSSGRIIVVHLDNVEQCAKFYPGICSGSFVMTKNRVLSVQTGPQ